MKNLQRGILYVFIILSLTNVKAQDSNVREQVFLHLNSNFLLAGETLYFSAFTTSMSTGAPSELSKILYVELVDSARNSVFQQKINLENGRGQGHYFFSSLIKTGRYQLLAYTQWMKNFGDYYESTITVVNPFEEYSPKKPSEELEITFHPEGNRIIEGKENTIVYKLGSGQRELSSILNGRIVSDAGDQIGQVIINETIGRFTLSPKAGNSYQLILEDENGSFSFFDLPEISPEKEVIHVTKRVGGYRFEIFDSGDTSKEVILSLSDGQNTVLNQRVYTNSAILIDNDQIPYGSYYAVIKRGDQELAGRVFIHSPTETNVTSSGTLGFKTRSSIELPVSLEKSANFSVSVRKVDSHNNNPSIHLQNYAYKLENFQASSGWESLDNQAILSEWKWKESVQSLTEVQYLPELRGEIISGTVSDLEVLDRNILFSITGEKYQVYVDTIDDNGNFQFQMESTSGIREAFISTPFSDQPLKDNLTIDRAFLETYPEFQYEPLALDSSEVATLVERSIKNQIDNAYYEILPDSTYDETKWYSPFGEFDHFYVLDDYNRFPEMYEHFIEFIPAVVARNNKSGGRFKIFMKYPPINKGTPPLILLDGVPVKAEDVLNFSPYKIESIGIFITNYFMGPLITNGIIAFHTFEKDLHGFEIGDNIVSFPYQGLELKSTYRFPTYETKEQKLSRIPDYRQQLYWNPNASSSGGPYTLKFYTGDTTGEFEAIIEGYYEDGQPFSIKKVFTVQEDQYSSN